MRRLVAGLAALGAAVLLCWAAPTAPGGDRPDLVVAAAAAYLAWGCLLWLCAGALLAASGRLPRLAERVVPALVRRVVAGAVGAGVVTGALAVPAVADAPVPPGPVVPVVPVDRPADAVLVVPGDSLWAIAARQLGPGAADPAVDAEWRRWYAANRAVIGPDPDLIHPGLRLAAPGR